MRIIDWSSTCALPIYAWEAAYPTPRVSRVPTRRTHRRAERNRYVGSKAQRRETTPAREERAYGSERDRGGLRTEPAHVARLLQNPGIYMQRGRQLRSHQTPETQNHRRTDPGSAAGGRPTCKREPTTAARQR